MATIAADGTVLDTWFPAPELSDDEVAGTARLSVAEVPEDLAVVGFDGTPASASTMPALTTVRQPLTDLGAGMAEMVLRHVEDPPTGPEHRILPVELVVRDSTPAVR